MTISNTFKVENMACRTLTVISFNMLFSVEFNNPPGYKLIYSKVAFFRKVYGMVVAYD